MCERCSGATDDRTDTMLSVVPLSAATYKPHLLHAEDRIWLEKNCYIDLWIELLHAQQLEPTAMLPFVLALDFEGDQWTFFKPSHDELRELYGVDVQELTVWRPLREHTEEHLGAGKWISTEADAWWLPDTAATDYRRQHTKTTIVLNAVDFAAKRLGYFHNAGYYELEGEDFDALFDPAIFEKPDHLPLFAELVRIDRRRTLDAAALVAKSRGLITKYLERRPVDNPVDRFAERFARDLPLLQQKGLGYYHKWAFGTIRQLGAGFELAALHLQWRSAVEGERYATAIECFTQIASANKTLILKAARAVSNGKPFDVAAPLREMSLAWQRGMDALEGALPKG